MGGTQLWSAATATASRTGDNPIVLENQAVGSDGWAVGHGGTMGVDEKRPQLQGYASSTSVSGGESLDFHIASHVPQSCTVAIYRVGHYGSARARHLLTGDDVRVTPRKSARAQHGSRAAACDWPVSWTLDVPDAWVSGIHLAVFTSEDGHRAYTPFVVRDTARPSDILIVLPFATYQADNAEDRRGPGMFKVSFDQPYAGLGLPRGFGRDTSTARWAEEACYDVTYATDLDLHEGRIAPSRHTAIVFSGRHAHWSEQMRDVAGRAVGAGTHLAFLGPDVADLRTRVEPAPNGRPGHVLTCYRDARDPVAGSGEQPEPLVVRDSAHWLWSGSELRDGEPVPGLTAAAADGDTRIAPPGTRGAGQTLLAEPRTDGRGQSRLTGAGHTRVYENGRKTLVFVAGTAHWPLALHEPEHVSAHVQRATAALLTRMLEPRWSRGPQQRQKL
ncbi:N,N-dimethylformamidase beta subunit family domain-containing protein [Streptomyces sp. TRM49041]|uniref:N,N-dimethylformamidase beta subunit family domain-containing protein n=1 Tax=Streptomyces sp. TRM49041 TaxID=2603216 RepID=UPI0021CD050E|nr:N,N-dimethylformamidase beta subunit family domain-containing protein [Streptomyces sp. TRM49041]